MLGFNHTLSGALVGVLVPAPLVAPAAFVLHFLLDMTPHFGRHKELGAGGSKFKYLLAIDGLLCTAGLLFAMYLFPDRWFWVGLGAFFSALPDFLWLLFKGKVKGFDWYWNFSSRIQWGERPYGLIYDATYGFMFAAWLIIFSLTTTSS